MGILEPGRGKERYFNAHLPPGRPQHSISAESKTIKVQNLGLRTSIHILPSPLKAPSGVLVET